MEPSPRSPPPAHVRHDNTKSAAAPAHIHARPFRDGHANINRHSTAVPHA